MTFLEFWHHENENLLFDIGCSETSTYKKELDQMLPKPAPYPTYLLQSSPPLKKQKLNTTEEDEQIKKNSNFSSSKINSQIEQNTSKNTGYVQGPLDPVFGQRRAFPISIDLSTVDLNKIPENVDEYLAQVRLEAEGKIVKMDSNEDSDNESMVFYIPSDNVSKNDEYLVPLEFIDNYLEIYKNGRSRYEKYRSNLTELDAIDLPETQKAWKLFISNTPAEISYIAQIIEEDEHTKLLVYFTKWLSINVNSNFLEWVFLLLEAIEDVLESGEISVLRGLGRKARKQVQAVENENKENFWKLLVIVGVFYGQKDLILMEDYSNSINSE